MEAAESVKIIEKMLQESRKSLSNSSFYFILWAAIMIPAGIVEWYIFGNPWFWLIWPIAGSVGGIITMIYSLTKHKTSQVTTAADRISGYTWGVFGICMLFAIFYSLRLNQTPHALILLLAGGATIISGGISKFKPFIIGGFCLIAAAVLCGFFIEPALHGLIFSAGLTVGYLIPGLMLRNAYNG